MNQSQPPRKQLLQLIDEVSFAVNDITLYLDTHPDDMDALDYYKEHMNVRNQALKEYARLYGPLTVDTAIDSCSECWQWSMQPFPWEGGNC